MTDDPYLLNNGTLKNLVGATTPDQLERDLAESVAKNTALEISKPLPKTFGIGDYKALHKRLFGKIFEWAGTTRGTPFRLSDGSTASMPTMAKQGSRPFLHGDFIDAKLKELFTDLRKDQYLQGLDRDTFATKAADYVSRLNHIHPFREGNGRTQRVFVQRLAIGAGHRLDFTALTPERNIAISIRANEDNDPTAMQRAFREAADPDRVAALKTVITALQRHATTFDWRDVYISTTEPGHRYENVRFTGAAGNTFMAQSANTIIVGWQTDLPDPPPNRGQRFSFVASDPSAKLSPRDHIASALKAMLGQDPIIAQAKGATPGNTATDAVHVPSREVASAAEALIDATYRSNTPDAVPQVLDRLDRSILESVSTFSRAISTRIEANNLSDAERADAALLTALFRATSPATARLKTIGPPGPNETPSPNRGPRR